MAIPNRQIGWSQESNLIWEIAYELDKLNKILGAANPGGNSPTGNVGLPSKQIGWSQEANLLYEVLKQVSRIKQTLG